MRMLTRSYDIYNHAVAAVNALKAAGVAHNDISVSTAVAGNTAENSTAATRAGASIGAALDGGAGLLAGLGAWASIGPVIETGWLITTLTGDVGAATGGPPKPLTGVCVDAVDAETYTDRVRRGYTLVTVCADDAMARQIESILEHSRACTVAGMTALGRVYHP